MRSGAEGTNRLAIASLSRIPQDSDGGFPDDFDAAGDTGSGSDDERSLHIRITDARRLQTTLLDASTDLPCFCRRAAADSSDKISGIGLEQHNAVLLEDRHLPEGLQCAVCGLVPVSLFEQAHRISRG